MRRLRTVWVLAAVLVAGQAAWAGNLIVFDNLGPTNAYINGGVWFGSQQFGSQWETVAAATDFIPSGTGPFNELWAAMWTNDPQYNQLTLSLLASDQNGLPGNVLWQQTYTGQLGAAGTVLHVNNLNGPDVTAGTKYWLAAEGPGVQGAFHQWYENAMNDMGLVSLNTDNAGWGGANEMPRLGLRVGVFPEPATLTLLAAGAGALAMRRRWKRAG